MILLKGLLGGVAAVLLAWVIVVGIHLWVTARSQPSPGLGAAASGWNYLLQLPVVVVVLSIAFGAGLFLTVRYVIRG